MKRIHIAGNLLKSLMLAGLLTACNHDQAITPVEAPEVTANRQNAKISALIRLVKDNDRSIQYVKSGKFLGKVSKVTESAANGYRYEYSYDDSNPNGDIWINKKKYFKSSNALVREWKYKITNGLCVFSEDNTGSYHYEYKYTAQGYLDEIKFFDGNSMTYYYKYSYNYNGASNSYRITNINFMDQNSNIVHQHIFTYTATKDNYSLNFENGEIDKYLPNFGKSGDVLIGQLISQWTDPKNPVSKKEYTYTLDADGLVTSKNIGLTLNNVYKGSTTEAFIYSTKWQGIP